MTKQFPSWIQRPDILEYIIESYAGVEPTHRKTHVPRRVFIWQEGRDVVMGNIEAFFLHLKQHFDLMHLNSVTGAVSLIHQLLRELGETTRRKTRVRGKTGREHQHSDPEQWVIGAR